MAHIGEVYFGLYGEDVDPDEISTFIGIAATRIAHKGSRNAEIPLPRESAWIHSAGSVKDDVIDVYDMSNKLIEHLKPYECKIVEAVQKFELFAVLQVVLMIDQDESIPVPSIGFEHAVLAFVVAVGATIDVDSYRIGGNMG